MELPPPSGAKLFSISVPLRRCTYPSTCAVCGGRGSTIWLRTESAGTNPCSRMVCAHVFSRMHMFDGQPLAWIAPPLIVARFREKSEWSAVTFAPVLTSIAAPF